MTPFEREKLKAEKHDAWVRYMTACQIKDAIGFDVSWAWTIAHKQSMVHLDEYNRLADMLAREDAA